MATWCNARLIVVGRSADVACFRRLAHARPSAVFRQDMLVGEAQDLFSERATPFDPGCTQKGYYFQARGEEGLDHFRDLSRFFPALSFVLVYGWDDRAYGSHYIFRGHARSYTVSTRFAEETMSKYGVEEGPDGEWPYDEERQAECELMDLAEGYWGKLLRRDSVRRSSRSSKRPGRLVLKPRVIEPDHYVAGISSNNVFLEGGGVFKQILQWECGHKHPTQEGAEKCLRSRRWKKLGNVFPVDSLGHCLEETIPS